MIQPQTDPEGMTDLDLLERWRRACEAHDDLEMGLCSAELEKRGLDL